MQNSYQVLNPMLNKLFEAEKRRLQKAIDNLHAMHQEASQTRSDGFMYQGKAYIPSHMHGVAAAAGRRTLHLSLWPKMEAHLKDRQQIDNDCMLIQQVLFNLIEPCVFDQHVRDAIPDCIIDIAPDHIKNLERMGGPNWQTQRDLQQYNKVLPKIEFYSASRLVY